MSASHRLGRHKIAQDFYHFIPLLLSMLGLVPVTTKLSIYLIPSIA